MTENNLSEELKPVFVIQRFKICEFVFKAIQNVFFFFVLVYFIQFVGLTYDEFGGANVKSENVK